MCDEARGAIRAMDGYMRNTHIAFRLENKTIAGKCEREWAVIGAEEMSSCLYSDYECCVRALLVASRNIRYYYC